MVGGKKKVQRFRLRCESPFAESCFLPKGWFEKIFDDRAEAVASAIEAMPDDGKAVQVVDAETGEVVWNSAEAEFEDDSLGID